MTSSNGNIFRVTGPLCGEFTGDRWIPLPKGQWRGALIFFDLTLNKRLSKQSRRLWFKTPSRSLWRHCNVKSMNHRWHFDGMWSAQRHAFCWGDHYAFLRILWNITSKQKPYFTPSWSIWKSINSKRYFEYWPQEWSVCRKIAWEIILRCLKKLVKIWGTWLHSYYTLIYVLNGRLY